MRRSTSATSQSAVLCRISTSALPISTGGPVTRRSRHGINRSASARPPRPRRSSMAETDKRQRTGPPFLRDRDGKPTKESGYYLSVNRAKRSVAIDLAAPEGQALVRRLAADVDIVIENFKAGALT